MYQYFWDVLPPASSESGSRGICSLSLHSFLGGDSSCPHFLVVHTKLCPTLYNPTIAHQASLSFTISQSLLKLMPISQRCHPTISSSVAPFFLLPSVFLSFRVLSSESALCNRWPKYWSFSFSISPPNEHSGWSPLGLTGFVSLLSKGLSRVFSSTTAQKYQFFSAQTSFFFFNNLKPFSATGVAFVEGSLPNFV